MKRPTTILLTLALLLTLLPASALAAVGESTDTFCSATGAQHSWRGWTTDYSASCTQDGQRSRVCGRCGYRQTETIKKTGHSWGKWKTTVEATCTQQGQQTRKCSVCDQTETRKTDKLAHTWGEWTVITEPTDHSAGTRTRTCKVCGTESTQEFDPEGTLRRGDSGDAVRKLQEGLICYGVLTGSADGSFGPGTEAAVQAAQEAEGLTADGVAWPQTQARLGHRFGEWETVQEMTDFTTGIRRRVCGRCGYAEEEETWPEPTYKRGDRGDGVKGLQEKLNAAGYDCGAADGDFGGKTEAAVQALEAANGFTTDGIAWPGVQAWLGGQRKTWGEDGEDASEFLNTMRGPSKLMSNPIPLTILTQPVGGDIDFGSGETLTLSVEVIGGEEPYSYNWYKQFTFQENDGTAKTIGHWQGEDSPELPVSAPGRYYCKIIDAKETKVKTEVVEVTSGLYIAEQPRNANLYGVDSVTLNCVAAGGEPFDGKESYIYTWYDENGREVEFSDVGLFEATEPGEYYCTVMDNNNVLVTSQTATVYDAEPLWIKCDAKYGSITPGEDTFDILMNFGGGVGSLTCEWYIDDKMVDSHPASGSSDLKTADMEGTYTLSVLDELGESESLSIEIVDQKLHIVEQTEAAALSEENPVASLSVTIIGGRKPYEVWWYWQGPDGSDKVVDIQEEITGSQSTYYAKDLGQYYCIAQCDNYGIFNTDVSERIPVTFTGGPYILEQPTDITLPAETSEFASVSINCKAVSLDTGSDDALEYKWEVRYPNDTTWSFAGSGRICKAKSFGTYRCVVTDTSTGETTTSRYARVFRKLECLDAWREGGDVINKAWIRARFRGGTPPYNVELYTRMMYDTPDNTGPYFLEQDIPEKSKTIEKEEDLHLLGEWVRIYYTLISFREEMPEIEGHLSEHYYVITDALGQVCSSDIVN